MGINILAFLKNAPGSFQLEGTAAGDLSVKNRKSRNDGLCFFVLGCLVFLLFGLALMSSSEAVDFKAQYYPAQTLLRGGDPYDQEQVLRLFDAEDPNASSESFTNRAIVTRSNYLPSSFPVTIPFALLPYGPAHWLWLSLTAGSLMLAAFLIWHEAAQYSPILSGALVAFLLASNVLILVSTNPAGISISSCVIGTWCFLRKRYVVIGVVCFAMALMLKPHDAGLVWVYFLITKTVDRKPAMRSLFLMLALSLPTIAWLTYTVPNWATEWRSNLEFYSMTGGINDPSPTAGRGTGMDRLINLQTATSLVSNDPRVYNSIAYLICGALFLVWLLTAFRARRSVSGTYSGLAVVSGLTMLPVYHRQSDAMLLLLVIPACTMLWSETRHLGRIAIAFSFAALYITGALPWVVAAIWSPYSRPAGEFASQLGATVQLLSAPILVLAMTTFYLWVYRTRVPERCPNNRSAL